jgi:aerobic C4-dicarboxylate transport protein
LLALLIGYALQHMGSKGRTVQDFVEECSDIFFPMMNVIMKLAPIGAGGAMAFTLGKYGLAALKPLAALMGGFYVCCALFVLVVLGTSSSESALVPLMGKLERLGCSKSVVGLVVPAGYSLNLDGTNIYLTLAVPQADAADTIVLKDMDEAGAVTSTTN